MTITKTVVTGTGLFPIITLMENPNTPPAKNLMNIILGDGIDRPFRIVYFKSHGLPFEEVEIVSVCDWETGEEIEDWEREAERCGFRRAVLEDYKDRAEEALYERRNYWND